MSRWDNKSHFLQNKNEYFVFIVLLISGALILLFGYINPVCDSLNKMIMVYYQVPPQHITYETLGLTVFFLSGVIFPIYILVRLANFVTPSITKHLFK